MNPAARFLVLATALLSTASAGAGLTKTQNPYLPKAVQSYQAQKYDQALEQLEKAADWEGNDRSDLALIEWMRGALSVQRHEEPGVAVRAFERALAIAPDLQAPVSPSSPEVDHLVEQARGLLGLQPPEQRGEPVKTIVNGPGGADKPASQPAAGTITPSLPKPTLNTNSQASKISTTISHDSRPNTGTVKADAAMPVPPTLLVVTGVSAMLAGAGFLFAGTSQDEQLRGGDHANAIRSKEEFESALWWIGADQVIGLSLVSVGVAALLFTGLEVTGAFHQKVRVSVAPTRAGINTVLVWSWP